MSMSSLLALTMRMGISSRSRSLRQIVFVSVDVNGIFSFGEENKILLWGQEGNQPPAGGIFRMFQIAVKKVMAGNFGGTRTLGYIFQIQIIIAAAQGWGAGRHNSGDDDSHENRHDKHDEVRNKQPAFYSHSFPLYSFSFTLPQMIDAFKRKESLNFV